MRREYTEIMEGGGMMQRFSIVVVYPKDMDIDTFALSESIQAALPECLNVFLQFSVFGMIAEKLMIEGTLSFNSNKLFTSETILPLISKPMKDVTLTVL